MIKSIWLAEGSKFILSCDGTKFLVTGESPIAESIRKVSKSKDSLFLKLFSEAKSDFDPVRYWYESSMNFADEAPPRPFSKELLELLTEELSILNKEED
jgi:hypothetical protein